MQHDDGIYHILSEAFKNAADAVIMVDATNSICLFNKAAQHLWKLKEDDVLGYDIGTLIALEDCHTADSIWEAKLDIYGKETWIRASLSAIDLNANAYRLLQISDISEQVRQREEQRLLTLLVNGTERPVILLDRDRKVLRVNQAFSKLFGYTLEEVEGRALIDVLASPNTDQALLTRLRQNATPEQSIRAEIILSDKAENDIWVSTTANPVLDDRGNVQNIIVILHDITEGRQIQSLQNDVMSAMTSGLPLPEIADLICRRVETIAPEVTASFLLVEDGILRSLAGPSLPNKYHTAITGTAIGEGAGSCGTAAWRGQPVLATDIDTDPLWEPYKALALPLGLLSCWSSPIVSQNGSVTGTFAFYFKEKRGPSLFHERIVSACLHLCLIAIEQHVNRQEIASLSHFDPLTGVLNRTQLYRRLDEQLEISKGRDLAVFVIGLDHFKDINDSFGHTAGDRVLVEVTDRLNELLKDRGFIGRIGGDLLALLMPKSSVRQASIIATQIFAAIRKPILLSDLNLTTDASIGISLFPDNGKDGETLIKQAEIAMYRVKQSGRGNSEFFSQEMNKIVHERMALASALRNAVANNGLRLHYQPQVRPESGELYGVEALARWSDPVFGDVPPEKFISLAEEIGEIDAIGEWTLRAACSQMAKWRADKTKVPIVSVNLSPLNFRDRKLPNSIAALLKEYELPASCLTIEITEGVMLDTSPQTFEILKNIRRLGVGISMDDFGTGYSSLSNLVSLPITEMKVDRIFIQNFETDDEIKVLVKAIIQLAKALGLTVIVEGIETEAQREMLIGLECDVIQGFLFGRPMPADAIANYVAK